MAIIVDTGTRLVVQGLTGSEGRFHGLRNRSYGTNVVAGVTPGKGGQDVEGIPVFDTVAEAVERRGRQHGDDLRPRPVRDRRDLRGRRRRHRDGHLHHRAHPRARHAPRLHVHPAARGHADRAELSGRALAGEGERRDHPGRGLRGGRDRPRLAVGTLTYQIGYELAQLGLGNSSIVGIGGDPVPGSSFIDILSKFESDPETEYVVMVGEIGGNEEEKAAEFIRDHMSKPVLAYIAGFTAPPGKTMGHAGAIISGSAGTAQAKKEALEACGVRVGTTPTEVAQLTAEVAAARA